MLYTSLDGVYSGCGENRCFVHVYVFWSALSHMHFTQARLIYVGLTLLGFVHGPEIVIVVQWSY
jgi:hypothetical protein